MAAARAWRRAAILALAGGLACVLVAGAAAALRPGVYQAMISGARPAALDGSWQLRLERRTFAVLRNGEYAVEGTITIAGDKITFSDLIGPFRCTGSRVRGTYVWTLRGRTLRLRPVQDPCSGRRTVLSRSFRKVR
jgi:hypothetical protein